MIRQSAGSATNVCIAVRSIASINSRDGQSSPLIETSQRRRAWAGGVARFRAALMIKLGSARSMTPAALVALTLLAGSAAARAQSCSGSPSYSPDFSSNQSCLALNGNASVQGSLLQIVPASMGQAGSVWYTAAQPVGSPFSTTFTFQLTDGSADGFAFLVQNAGTGALGPGGCGMGFADDPLSGNNYFCGGATGGIPNSLAIGFKTYTGDGTEYPPGNSVFIASNGTGANCENVPGAEYSGSPGCVIAENFLTSPSITLANGNVHTVTVTYTPQPSAAQTYCPASAGCLDVVLDGTDLFPNGVSFSMTSIGLTGNLAYVGFTSSTGAFSENSDILNWTFTPQSFGEINVCPAGATTPAPCSNTLPVTFNFTESTAVGSVQVVTQGVSGLDFQLGSGSSTCTGSVTSCTVNVTFAPKAPGLRMGAVNLLAGSSPGGTPLATALIYGIGQGPAIAFEPGTQTTLPTSGLTGVSGVAVDAAGNIFISNNAGAVKLTSGVQTTLPTSGLSSTVYDVAVDGAGDVFLADTGNSQVVEVTPSGVQTKVPATGLSSPTGVAVDGAGDVFITDTGNNQVVEVTPSGVQTTVPTSGVSGPYYPAVDAAGDVYFLDAGHERVLKVTPGGVQSTIPTSGLASGNGVAVDAAGDVFVSDQINNVVLEVTASGVQTTVPTTGLNVPAGLAVDAAGDVFIADNGQNLLYKVNRSQPPSLSFAATIVGTSTDSPQTVSVQNVGNTALDFSAIAYPTDFPEALGETTDCSTANILNAGGICTLSIDFMPTSGGLPPNGTILSEAVGLTDNALNVSGSTQSVSVQGAGVESQVAVPNLLGQTQTAASTLLTGAGLDLGAVTFQASTVPIGEVISQNPAGGTSAPVNSSVSVVLSSGVTIPNVVGQTQSAATTAIATAGLVLVQPVTTQFSDTVPSGIVISQNPAFPSTVNGGTPVNLIVSNGGPPASDQLTLENNYFVTGDYASAGVTLREAPIVNGMATSAITIPSGTSPGSVPDGADIIDGFLYWTTIEPSGTSPSGNTGTFLGYSITGQQIGSDVPNYSDGTNTGILRVYRADVNTYFQVPAGWNGARLGSGSFSVTLPNSNGIVTEGASLVVIWRVLSPNFPLKSVVIYDGSIVPASLNVGPIPQAVQGFYDSAVLPNVTGENTILSTSGGSWNNGSGSVTLPVHSNQYIETLTAGNQTLGTGNAYAAVILSTPVSNSDNDGILDAWKAGPPAGDPNYGNPGYYDAKTGSWVPLPGATHGEQDLFVQFDYMCSALTGNACDFTQPNLYPSPDAQGNDPLAMVTQAYANIGVHLHLVPGNAILETTCTDTGTNPSQLCMFPNEPGVVTWDGSVQLSKVLPANYVGCTANPSAANCAPRFPYGQKDSYHYVLFGYSVAIPSWTTRSGSITSITVSGATANSGGSASIVTTGLGTTCPTRVTITGVQGNPNLNGIYENLTCDGGLTTISFSTPVGGPNWSYSSTNSNGLAEPAISVTSGTVTTMSGFSDLGGSDSVVSLGAWATSTAQNMSKSATVVAGTLFHEIGHTLGLTHGGLYFDTQGSYIPTFEANCKPNFQSTMNYLFQIDGLGPNATIAYSNQTLFGEAQGGLPTVLAGDSSTAYPPVPNPIQFGSVYQLTDSSGALATYSTSSWYTTTRPSTTTSPATMHCDGSPLDGNLAYRVTGQVDPISPAWLNEQNITFDGAQYSDLRGYNDVTSFDLRQVGAASGELAALANEISYRSNGVFYGGSGGLSIGGSGGLSIGGSGGLSIGGSGGLSIGGSGGLSIGGSGGLSIGGSGGLSIGGSGGLSIGGSGGVLTEVDYLTANSIVRPPSSPTLTPVMTNGAVTSVTVDWKAPAFGVVQYYTVYRGCNPNGSDAVNIGVVYGVGGATPATEFIDSNPVTCSGSSTVVYTISTTLNPVQIDPTQRSSAPSVPAIVKNLQTIVLGPLQSSVTYSTPPPTVTVTATAESNSNPNGLPVNFVATGPCSVSGQTVAGGVSKATVSVNDPGSSPAICTLSASQPGTNPTALSTPPYYDAANSVSESFTIEPAGSTTQSQTINFAQLQNVQYGSSFSVSASTLPSGQTVSFTAPAIGPCTVTGSTVTTTAVGVCRITASASGYTTANNTTYSAASLTQSFTITPAVLTVTANPIAATYGQPLPALTYSFGTFVNRDTSSVVSGAPALTTTATQGSNVGPYPITVTTGTLAAANYSFLFVPGILTIKQAAQTIIFSTNAPPSATYPASFPVAASAYSGSPATANGNAVTFTASGGCSVAAGTTPGTATYTMISSTVPCSVIASQTGNSNYAAATPVTETVNANGPALTVNPTIISFGTVSLGSITTKTITVTNIGTAPATINDPILSIVKGGNSNEFVAVNLCLTPLAVGKSCTITIAFVAGPFYTPQTATLEIMDNAPGSPQPVALSATVLEPQTITFTTNPPASAAYNSSFKVAASAYSGSPATANGNPVSFTASGSCSNSGATYTMTSGTGTCSVIANQAGNSTYAAAAQVTKTVTATLAAQTITFSTSAPTSAAYKTSFTVAASAYSGSPATANGNTVTFTSSGACSNSGATYTMTSSTGMCSVIANQAGNSDYSAAPKVTESVTATLAAQAITFTTSLPATAAYKTSFTVAATGGASGNAVTFTSSGSCSNSGTTYTMTSGTGTCKVTASQAGNTNYAAATPITTSVTATYSAATLSPSPNLSFGTVNSNKSSSLPVTLTNTGTTPLIISSIGITGTNASNFSETNNCPNSSSSLAAGKYCTISVTFTSGGKSAVANLTVTDNTSAGSQTVSLSGN